MISREIYREMSQAALDLLAQRNARIAALEAQVKALKDELRRYLAEKMKEEA